MLTDFLEQVRTAGVVGCGGAGFPTHVKLAARGVDTLIINGAECEPLLRTDRWLMRNQAAGIVQAVEAARAQLNAQRAVVALKADYSEEIAALKSAIANANAQIELHLLESFYPAGDEQVMVYEATGRVVPPAGIPLDVQCVVSNAATMYAVWQAMQGRPFTQKYLTITGAVREPCVIKAPLGTNFADCLALAGGTDLEDYIIVSGGPMMGKLLPDGDIFVEKTTSGFLVLPKTTRYYQNEAASLRHILGRARSACIQCSFCTQLCPRWLLGHPLESHKIMRRAAGSLPLEEQLDDPVLRSAQYCCECGVCELVACPMQLAPRRINAQLKQAYVAQNLRPFKGEAGLEPREFREERKLPTGKAALRAGVYPWYHRSITRFAEVRPSEVHIALNSHIGAPALPCVKPGDHVELGQCIAKAPADALGVPYHASIAGVVECVNGAVTIRGMEAL